MYKKFIERRTRLIMNILFVLFMAMPFSISCGGGGGGSGSISQLPTTKYGTVKVSANISGGYVYIDGKNTNVKIPASLNVNLSNISAGNHTVTINQSGYITSTSSIVVTSGQTTSVTFVLSPSGNNKPVADAGNVTKCLFGPRYEYEGWVVVDGNGNATYSEHVITCQLVGSGSSDPDGDTVTYSWTQTQGPTVSINDPSASDTYFVPNQAGTYEFEISVNDGYESDSDTVLITVSALSGKIVFSMSNGVGSDIFSVDFNKETGNTLKQLTDTDIDESWPAWSPDGGTIAYNKVGTNWGIYYMNPDGSNQRQPAPPIQAYNPHYSPDGTKMAVTGPGNQIYLADLSNNSMTQLTNLSVNYLGPECWLPDNLTIVFSGEYVLGSYNDEIMTIQSDGSGYQRITNNTLIDRHANATPDGRLIYTSQDVQYGGPYGHKKLYLMNADGTGNTLIGDEDHGYQYPVMTSDGNYIFYSDESGYIHVMTADGSLDQNLGIWGKELDYTPH